MFRPLVTASLFLLLAVSARAGEIARSKAELEQLQARITAVQASLNRNLDTEKSVTAELDRIDRALAAKRADLRQNEREAERLKMSLRRLAARSEALQHQNAAAMSRLGSLAKSAYMLGQQSGLRMFINQQDPHAAARRMTMFRYVMDARNRQLRDIAALQADIVANQKLTQARQKELDEVITLLTASAASLETSEAARQRELSKVKSLLKDEATQLSIYRQREKSLQRLLVELQRPEPVVDAAPAPAPRAADPADTPTQSDPAPPNGSEKPDNETLAMAGGKVGDTGASSQETDSHQAGGDNTGRQVLHGFRESRGKLPRPVDASVKIRFGDRKAESGLRWDGVLFGARNGQPVQAIYPGQVVFSDWFRGYGQLMVVDHGDGYMSLYGHNQALQATVGDSVNAGDTIARANDAAEQPLPGLYFEIRHNGAPSDPLKWTR